MKQHESQEKNQLMTTALVVPRRGLETDVFYHLSVSLTNEKQCYKMPLIQRAYSAHWDPTGTTVVACNKVVFTNRTFSRLDECLILLFGIAQYTIQSDSQENTQLSN